MDNIYIELMNCLLSQNPIDNISQNASKWSDALKDSCRQFEEILTNKKDAKYKLGVGIEGDLFLEPCPIATSASIENKKFEIAVIGLNPGREDAYLPVSITWEQLANFHCPNQACSYSNDTNIIGKNMYWRCAGNLNKKNVKWSPYYKAVFMLHQALVANNVVYNSWREIQNDNENNLTDYFLHELTNHPMINAEFIPYKSVSFDGMSTKQAKELLEIPTYKSYLKHMLGYIFDKLERGTWIVFNGKTDKTLMMLDVLRSEIDVLPCSKKEAEEKFVFKCRGSKFYYFQWEGRNILLTPFLKEQTMQSLGTDMDFYTMLDIERAKFSGVDSERTRLQKEIEYHQKIIIKLKEELESLSK